MSCTPESLVVCTPESLYPRIFVPTNFLPPNHQFCTPKSVVPPCTPESLYPPNFLPFKLATVILKTSCLGSAKRFCRSAVSSSNLLKHKNYEKQADFSSWITLVFPQDADKTVVDSIRRTSLSGADILLLATEPSVRNVRNLMMCNSHGSKVKRGK
ncbi:Protein CBG26555 [Caenorhabditis briggsae]|uniref:Protein CBG26555 n=1 Tax=Caenorhabditis briggsae TaxID=6238 RepID=B6IM23_CAEBR|nr:Protein CBG26555 [Caenorhabditis briggsae]CAS00953.1 Protein CBG26555 [Caenorhabditis briggsae]